MICPKCKIYATKEVALFSSVEHVCPSCDGGSDWVEFNPDQITFSIPDASPLRDKSFTIHRGPQLSPHNEGKAVDINVDEILPGRLGGLGSYTVPKDGRYSCSWVCKGIPGGVTITLPEGMTVDLEKLKSTPGIAEEKPIHWGGICDMP